MKNVFVFFADGFEEIEALTIVDVLRRAEMNVKTVSVTGKEVVTGAHDVRVTTDSLFENGAYDSADIVVLPGGMPGAGTLSDHEGVKNIVRAFVEKGKWVAAICAAPMVLGKMGLLKNKNVTCYPGFEKYLEGANCTGKQVEVDDNIITGRGPGAAMDFSLMIVEKLLGKAKSEELITQMCVIK